MRTLSKTINDLLTSLFGLFVYVELFILSMLFMFVVTSQVIQSLVKTKKKKEAEKEKEEEKGEGE